MNEADPQQLVCIFCLPRLDPLTGDVWRNCDLCAGRSSDRWCECTYCEWIERHP